MGNANTHKRKKLGVAETWLTIENISEEPRVEEAALVTTKSEEQSEETPDPSFATEASVTSVRDDEVEDCLKKIPTIYNFDNEWTNDKNLPTVDNQHGSKNNVISIQQEDFEAFAALDMDSKATNVRHQHGVETEFGQEIPALDTYESSLGPPILPPHLRQGFLNLHKDTPLSCEPTSLPEPDHVMINHLYAGPIKDGVMVFSSTQRFRNKYSTRIHYKPIEP